MASGVLAEMQKAEYAEMTQEQKDEISRGTKELLKGEVHGDDFFNMSPTTGYAPSYEDIMQALSQSLPDPSYETKIHGLGPMPNWWFTLTLPPLMDSAYETTDHEPCDRRRWLRSAKGELVKKAGLGNHLRPIGNGNFEMTPKLTEAYNRWNGALPLDEYLRRCRLNE